ncbi:OF BC1 COMPLEX KINASE 3, chloroplastic [Seminavis robusta]|uniref:OF BC1 COMPLEX KINASE 3, chloroplastic n=1 Tax=Seminavis robusta TaxID=568900 RepID=A0A9N8DP84_9STRA|nr:OF BC1 COMPLEX KINASE 3, chloroplastic [Seminavis robusta]|eukprot:Sro256_g100760.1 OF BC1 COMPLEX KINASE 3, chloroplastic (919) ;mRNA; r:73721-76564
MRFLLSGVVFTCLLLQGSTAFVPASRRAAKKTAKSLLPSSVSFDVPSWLVDASATVDSSVSLPSALQFPELSQQLASLAASVNLNGVIDPELSASLSSAVTVPWYLELIAAFAAGNAFLLWLNSPDNEMEAPYEPGTTTYSPEAAAEYYGRRPLLVAKRILRLALLTGAFNTGVLFDWLILGKLFRDEEYTALKRAEPRRAKVALSLCEKLGPTFIKLGQALSIRTDLIPEAYALELRKLQDAVPPFDSDEARRVICDELGIRDVSEVFSTLSSEPVASASIGQVYRGTLATNGKDVAVKVQRPGILAEIALDLHVLRVLSPIQTILQNAANGLKTSQVDIDNAILLIDEWGRGFVAETDYLLEAKNTIDFGKAMENRGLNAVCAPRVVDTMTRNKLLVTEWVEGTRLDRDASPDVPRLCGVAINAYLTMLLDTGVLHCDPHPGNLLRTMDGKLCILDHGMTLEVPKDLQYSLLEFIAHVNTEDYDAIPQDFINLGFSPEGVTADRLKDSGITEGLTFAFRQLSEGGGPKKIQERVKQEFQERYGSDLSDKELQQAARAEMLERMEAQLASEGVDVKGVTNVMEEMSRRNRELFALPPYVLYVARAFSTLEGIGLSVDENYGILQECYPYLSRRLFTDRSPRAKSALRAMLGLSENAVKEDASTLAIVQAGARGEDLSSTGASRSSSLSPSKLVEMSEGFASYTAATADVDRDGAGQAAAVAEFTKLLLDPKGSTLQDILVDETAKLGDAAVVSALRAALVDSTVAKAAATALKTPKELLRNSPASNLVPGPLKAALFDRPAELPELVDVLLRSSAEDERILSTAQELTDVISKRSSDGGDNVEALTGLLRDEETRATVTEQLPGIAALSRRVGAGLLRRAAYRTEQSAILPGSAKEAISRANEALADAIDYDDQGAR